MIPGHRIIAFRFKLPDGDHIATHNTYVDPKWTKEEKQAHLVATIKQALSQSPDAELLEDSLVDQSEKPGTLHEMVRKLREENPDRPLANDLGLDANNRLLTNPEIARTL